MTNRRKFWLSQKEIIEKKILSGINVRKIAKEYKITFQQMYVICGNINIDILGIKAEKDAIRMNARKKAKEEALKLAKERRKEWYLAYWADLHGRKPRKKAYRNQPTEGVEESVLEARRRTQEYNKRNRLKLMCRRLCNHVIEMGWIVKGVCSVCGTLDRVEAHHQDYYHPFQIVWVCKHHHHQLYHSGANHHLSTCTLEVST